MDYDILIKNGRVIDPAAGINEIRNIAISGNKIVPVEAGNTIAEWTVDAKGCYVLPGLIDFHAHVFYGGSEYAVKPETCLPFGVTSLVDPGTAGSANFDAFYNSIICGSIPRIKSYISVNPGGLYAREYHTIYNESFLAPGCLSYKNIKAIFEKYPDQLLGLKLMLSTANVGDKGIEILEATIRLAEEIGCSVCVHTTKMSVSAADVAKRLRAGDIFCHCFTYSEGDSILDADGTVNPDVQEAKKRGVLFDAANGSVHYDHDVAEKAIKQGFLPDMLSTDVVVYLANYGYKVRNLPFLMSKYMNIGLDISDVVRMVTAEPAKLMGMEGQIGTLQPGAYADVAIIREEEKHAYFEDGKGTWRETDKLLVPQMTIVNGAIVYSQVDFNTELQ